MLANFYWDDIDTIKACANEPFLALDGLKILADGRNVPFKIVGHDDFNMVLKTGEKYNPQAEYAVYYYDKAFPLTVRMLVQSPWFDENMLPYISTLGSFYHRDRTLFRVWAPFIEDIRLILNGQSHPLKRKNYDVYETWVNGDLDKSEYYYELKRNGKTYKLIDPFAYASTLNAQASYVLDIDKFNKERIMPSNRLRHYSDAVIYECSIRDFSHDPYFKNRSLFLGMCEEGLSLNKQSIGYDYLKELGITHVQLMPVMDFGSVDEVKKDKYNWGYDPVQYNVCEGSYIKDINDPYARVNELISLVNALHRADIRVNLDVVFNHVYKAQEFALNIMCPYYFYRYKDNMELSNGSFCGNEVRTEALFMRQYILLMIERYINIYDIDGLRFDLMGLMDIDTLKAIDKMTHHYKGDFMLYGEGWTMPTVLKSTRQSTIANAAKLENIAFFNPAFRDIVKGSSFPDHRQDAGYALGNVALTEKMKNLLLGDENDGFIHPGQSINYVECHDNYTYFDKMLYACPEDDEKTRIKKTKLALGLVILSQGIPFIHSGQEFMRTKKGIDNSYNQSDEINHLDWERKNKYRELVRYTKELLKIRKKYAFLRLDDYQKIRRIAHFENYYEVLVYNIGTLKILINPCVFRHLYTIREEYRMIHNENGFDDVLISRCVGVPEYSIVILERI